MDMSEGLSVYQKRLLTCAAIVRNGNEAFELGTWSCGTARCAVGDYCLSGVSEMKLMPYEFKDPEGNNQLQPVFDRYENWTAVEKHFGVDYNNAQHLFAEHAYRQRPSRAEVADRIEDFALHTHADAVKVGR